MPKKDELIILNDKSIFEELILSNANAIILISDSQANIVYASPFVKDILGYNPDELMNDGWWTHAKRVQGETKKGIKEHIVACANGSKKIDNKVYINEVYNKQGNIRWIQWQDSILVPGFVIGVGQDVTDDKLNELLIKEQSQQLEFLSLVASNTGSIVIILNPVGNLIWANDPFEKAYNSTLRDFIKEKGSNIKSVSSNKNIEALFIRCINTKKAISYESAVKNSSNTEHWYLSIMSPVLDENEQIKYIIIVDTEITEEKKLEKQIETVNEDIIAGLKYARHIQSYIFPKISFLRNYFSDYSILNKPKEIVGGDFCWANKIDQNVYIAIGDSTGHGSSAAMLSVVAITLLNRICKNISSEGTSEILNIFFKEFNLLFSSKNETKTTQDSLDIAFFSINYNTLELQYSGINRPLLIVRENEILEYLPTKIRFEKYDNKILNQVQLSETNIQLNKGDIIIAFSDGYQDQFGGSTNKRFTVSRFKKMLLGISTNDLKEQITQIDNSLGEWKGQNEQTDDIIIFMLKI